MIHWGVTWTMHEHDECTLQGAALTPQLLSDGTMGSSHIIKTCLKYLKFSWKVQLVKLNKFSWILYYSGSWPPVLTMARIIVEFKWCKQRKNTVTSLLEVYLYFALKTPSNIFSVWDSLSWEIYSFCASLNVNSPIFVAFFVFRIYN